MLGIFLWYSDGGWWDWVWAVA